MLPDQLPTSHPDLHLRAFLESDAQAVYDYWQSDPGWERFNASVPENFQSADAKAFVAEMHSRDRSSAPNWAITHRGRVVGVVSLSFEQGHRVAVIGYGIHGELRGLGLTGVAVATVIDAALECYPPLMQIRAHTDPENAASIRVLEKLGFSREETLQQQQLDDGRLIDDAVFGLPREAWA